MQFSRKIAAPHTRDEKSKGESAPGFPSIEYMLPLLLTAFRERNIDLNELIVRLYDNPLRIFNLPPQPRTYIEVDMNEIWKIPENGGYSKSGWTPYAGRVVRGRVRTVVMRGEEIYVDGDFVAARGVGQNIRTTALASLDAAVQLDDVHTLSERRDSITPPALTKQQMFNDKQRRRRSDACQLGSSSPPRPVSPYRLTAARNKLYNKDLLSVIDLDKRTISQAS